MPRPTGSKNSKKVIKPKIKLEISADENYCRKCMKVLPKKDFYDAVDMSLDNNKVMSVCRVCCNSLYNDLFGLYKDVDKALYFTCQKLNIRYSTMALEQAMSHISSLIMSGKKGDAVFGYYKSKLSSLVGKVNEGISGLTFEHSDSFGNSKDIDVRSANENCGINEEYLRAKWGSELPGGDLFWLEQKFDEWYDNYDIQGKAMQLLVEQLCFEELYVYKDRQMGRDVSKRLTNIQTMLKSSKLSPRQETASDMAEFQTITEFIRKVEQTRPFTKGNEESKDIDGMEKQWRSIAGAISRTQGRQDDNTQVFDEFFKDHTMDLSSLSDRAGG